MKLIQSKSKLKNDNMEEPDIYLCEEFSKMDNGHGRKFSAMASYKYCVAMVKNIEETLEKKFLKLPYKCVAPLKHEYRPYWYCKG